ncbi:adenylate kinase 5, chloroplastic-like isoform X1 [Zingiber officinale]|uniref:adenylate kinase 5, chloroplastic-like isoform X1 n=1 Tax=Zingiber officinale TaxID=94328 RepID=UPI001C4D33D4|nr:adenylate kinase 5, chloroplastic-like isoform X1 [Zingiber officinale]
MRSLSSQFRSPSNLLQLCNENEEAMATAGAVIPAASTITYRTRTSATCTGPLSSFSSSPSRHHRLPRPFRLRSGNPSWKRSPKSRDLRLVCYAAKQPLKVMISGAPASGKGTQCEMIVKKYGLVHISTGDLLRSEVAAETEIGKKAKEFMDNGMLVPDEIVTNMVLSRLSQNDVREKGWLLDGYPRSSSQAASLEGVKLRPDVFILLDVPDEILIDRCIGRRLDPVTRKIYHLKNFPPETEEISARIITRTDDSEEKVKSRLETYKRNCDSILPIYKDLLKKVNGNRPKENVFADIDSLLQQISDDFAKTKYLEVIDGNSKSTLKFSSSSKEEWRGIPTRLNNVPHSKEIRTYFYVDVLHATQNAINDKRRRVKVEINIPELNPEMDVYRIGTLMELVRTLALSFADDGKCVKVCVQGSMGEGALSGMPLQLAGTRKILEFMDWGEYGALGTFVKIGSIGPKEVEEQDDIFILVAPQNAVGNCIIDDMKAMTDAAGERPVILINPRLKDLPASSGIMQTMGRAERLEYAASFENCYSFRLLYYSGTQYPIMGALRMSYPQGYELYKRIDESLKKEKYVLIATFPKKPTGEEINDAFEGKPRNREKRAAGVWGFLSSILS